MKELNLVNIHKYREQKQTEELTENQMNRTGAGNELEKAACEDWCTVSKDAIGELLYFISN